MSSNVIFILLLATTLSSCEGNSNSYEGPCMVYKLSILELEEQVNIFHQQEGRLKEELEGAQQYIQTLEYENSVLDSLLQRK